MSLAPVEEAGKETSESWMETEGSKDESFQEALGQKQWATIVKEVFELRVCIFNKDVNHADPPLHAMFDRGGTFNNGELKTRIKEVGTITHFTPALQPSTNGFLENKNHIYLE
ncbi:hypothetical protein BT69DRAFT_1333248 [Atractiella rhizophila]|nr:hypothetical protein BT69DRAFT_1333248 [Atractiella rhizophila]